MSNEAIKNKIKKSSIKDTTWLKEAKWRQANEEWLDVSFAIALKILHMLKENKAKGIFPSNQKELATVLECTPQYVNKLVKGKERLTLETILKIEKSLGFSIILPEFSK